MGIWVHLCLSVQALSGLRRFLCLVRSKKESAMRGRRSLCRASLCVLVKNRDYAEEAQVNLV
ncbi:hypothetical protein E2C01_084235 [Portunus trituberculatus]|uniref:Uncharacterized protein n=1 Tax=Portunus trituberculatus TaxID=210409 RepID=A0A5B7J5S3_PORTR|nr:hypothetical protein [Portunus trituberculatus]